MSAPRLEDAFESPAAKRRHTRWLFAAIAPRYDLITRLLSFGLDQSWKRRLVSRLRIASGTRVLDLASGTGDLARMVASRGARVVALDITPAMLTIARGHIRGRPEHIEQPALRPAVNPRLTFVVGDIGALPIATGSVDVVTVGYGLRNAPDLSAALAEAFRVLAPGGQVASLDFNRPESSLVRTIYLAYLTNVGGALGWLLHGDRETYTYIPASIRRYPSARGVSGLLREAGFLDVEAIPLLGGLMTIHVGRKGQ